MAEPNPQSEMTELDPDVLTCVSGGNGCHLDPYGG